MPKSPEEMEAAMVANMKEKTGKSMEQWLKVAKTAKKEKHGQLVKALKEDHGMTHGFANLVAHKFFNPGGFEGRSENNLVDSQYSGPKAELRPIYDALVKAVEKFGKDVEISPKKTYVSLRRSKQFGLIQPSTKTRVDVGINLKGKKPTKRLLASGSFNSMVSHKVPLTDKKEVDAELKNWLKEAYEDA